MEETRLTKADQVQNNIIIAMANNDLYDLYDQDSNAIPKTVDFVIEHLNINKLKKAVSEAIDDLSRVAEPNMYADMNWIAIDNQRRLGLIHNLHTFSNNMDTYIKNIKKYKNNREYLDTDYEFSFLLETQKFCKELFEYKNLKDTEVEDSMFQPNLLDKLNGILTKEDKKRQRELETSEIKRLKGGE